VNPLKHLAVSTLSITANAIAETARVSKIWDDVASYQSGVQFLLQTQWDERMSRSEEAGAVLSVLAHCPDAVPSKMHEGLSMSKDVSGNDFCTGLRSQLQ
jgi:hypothetical protein